MILLVILGFGHDCTLRCSGRIWGGAQRFRQPQPDIPGQWTCSVCGQDRVWPVRNRCFRCGCPRGHDSAPSAGLPYAVGPTGRLLQSSKPVNPTYRPNQRPHQPMAPTASVQNFPPLNQPWSHRRICDWFSSRVPGGKFGLAQELLAADGFPSG